MPKLSRERTRGFIAELDWTVAGLAAEVEIPGLRNAVSGRDPISLPRIHRIKRAMERRKRAMGLSDLDISVESLLADDELRQPSSQVDSPRPAAKAVA